MRHACEQNDKLDGYTWTEYDAREGGVQVIKDTLNNVKLTTEFLKVAGGDHGGSWAARIKGEPIHQGIYHYWNKIKIKISNLNFPQGNHHEFQQFSILD